MELTNLPMFGFMRERLNWLSQRQEVVAQNTANSDTPEYRSRDIKEIKFEDVMRQKHHSNFNVEVRVTDPKHIQGLRRSSGSFNESDVRRPYETAPDGNSVVLEEQMMKLNETSVNHNAMTQLYKKHMAMFKSVIKAK